MIDVGIIGAGPLAQSLLGHKAPLGKIRIADAADPAVHAVLVCTPPGERITPMLAALRAGKIVLCTPPIGLSAEEVNDLAAAAASGGGRLLSGGEIVHSEAGRRGLAAIRAPEFGALRSLYLSIRQPRGGGGDVLDALGWEALDFIGAALPGGVSQVRVNGGALFGATPDTVVLLLRGDDDAVVTVELSRCLPPTLPAPGLGEVEIEAIGARQTIRIEPQASAVRIHADAALSVAPWLDPPVLAMLHAIEHAADQDDALPRVARALAVMTAIRAARDGTGVAKVA